MASSAITNFVSNQAAITAQLLRFRRSGVPVTSGNVGPLRYTFKRSSRFSVKMVGHVLVVTIPKGAN